MSGARLAAEHRGKSRVQEMAARLKISAAATDTPTGRSCTRGGIAITPGRS